SDIVLTDGYPFNAPASFSLGGHKVSMTVDIPGSISDDNDGWRGLILPFTPDTFVYGEEFTPRTENALTLLSLNGSEDNAFTAAEGIVANQPYLANVHAPFAKVPVTFIATGKSSDNETVYDVAFTPVAEGMSIRGSEFTLYGAYNDDNDMTNAYVLNENGTSFRHIDADSVTSSPFSVFVRPNGAVSADSIPVGKHPVWVFNPASANDNGFKLYRSETVKLSTETAGSTIYYTTDGSDPAVSETRIAYEAPFNLNDDTLSINAIAEFKGYLSEPVSMTYELRKTNVNYDLAEGWNWISHNVENEVPVESIISENVDRILSQTEEAIRDPQFGVVGNLSTLNPLEAYKVFTSGAETDKALNGVSFDPSVAVTLNRGWNWIGCPMEDNSLAISDAFMNLEAEEGDMIVGREGFAQVDANGNWIGDLRQLKLGHGYMYLSASVKSFNYNTIPSSNDTRQNIVRQNTQAAWTLESHKYPSVMPITSQIAKEGGVMAKEGEFEIAAFCGDECRGIGVCVDGWTMISVFGNPGDEISFRVLSTNLNREYTLSQTIRFAEDPVGTLNEPFVFDASSSSSIKEIGDGSAKIIVENGNIEIAGDTQSVKLVEIYDIAGMKEASATNADKLKFENLKTGVHIVVIYTADGHVSRKVEVK
ncbi:MAG: chitobiase/beta-hexosaminidase C-terminal domain-containing protein, partial [Duncaniella sp.]|nr:chitobiase/beta-hexosaminidase C-terminal domain-containing protein [Duncaniella sp.]